MGGGLDIVVGPGRIIIAFTYTLGFIDNTVLTYGTSSEEGFETINNVLSFLVGYGVDFGGI